MIVLALEGCHGCGKTELVNEFANAGFCVLDEAFLDMPLHSDLHPQSLLMETNWVCNWFQRLLQVSAEEDSSRKILITDRSPISAVFYTSDKKGKLLAPLISAQIQELREVQIDIFTIHIKCDADVAWNRVQRRLQQEPERALYKEDSREWLLEVKDFYDSFQDWDLVVENSDDDLSSLRRIMSTIIDQVSVKSPMMRSMRRFFSLPENECLSSPKLLRLNFEEINT